MSRSQHWNVNTVRGLLTIALLSGYKVKRCFVDQLKLKLIKFNSLNTVVNMPKVYFCVYLNK